MSSFSDTFTRDDNKNTQYDDSAFFPFATTILIIGLIVLVYNILNRICYSEKLLDKTHYSNCDCSCCAIRIKKHYKAIKKKKMNFWFYFMILMVIFLTYLTYSCYTQVLDKTNIFKKFDPHDILGVTSDATDKEIKKAYRKLSLLHHPDKNPNNLQAKAMFMLINKAYEALTDETAKRNYELYGNPDGPGSMRVAIGLPSFVLNKKNHMPILVIFLLIIIVILPVFVWLYLSDTNKYDDTGLQVDNMRIFLYFLNENILSKQIPFVFGHAHEFSKMIIRSEEEKELDKLWKSYKDQFPKSKEEMIPWGNRKAICLIYAFLNNQSLTAPTLKTDTDDILKKLPELIENIYKLTMKMTYLHFYDKNVRFLGFNCLMVVIEFSQNIFQKLGRDSSPFCQLPYFEDSKLKSLGKIKGDHFAQQKFVQFLNLPLENKNELLKSEFTEQQIQEIETVSQNIPQYEIKPEIFVEGFDEILVNDFITTKFTITRKNLPKEKEVGVSHSNNFPYLFKEKVVLLLLHGNNNMIGFEKVVEITERETTFEFKEMARMEGKFRSRIKLISLNYKGIEMEIPLELEIKKSSLKREAFIRNIESKEVKKLEPSLFQQIISSVIPIPNDDEEEEEEEEPQTQNEQAQAKENNMDNEPLDN